MKNAYWYWFALVGISAMGCNVEVNECYDEDGEEGPCIHHYHESGGSGGESSGSGGSNSGSGGSSSTGGSTSTGGAESSGGSAGTASTTGGSGGTAGEAGAGGSGAICSECTEPDGGVCLWGETELEVCCDTDTLEQIARDACAAASLKLSSVEGLGACDGGHSGVRYQCCAESPMVCQDHEVTFDACFAASALEALAQEACAADSAALESFEARNACEESGFCEASFTCCSAN